MVRVYQDAGARLTLYEDFYSTRIRVDDYSGDLSTVHHLMLAALPPWTQKLIVKSRPGDVDFFRRSGFTEEAKIDGYFEGVNMHFMVKYLLAERGQSTKVVEEERIIQSILTGRRTESSPQVSVEYATLADAEELASLYSTSFKVYPTPVNDPVHIRKTMNAGTVYVVVREEHRIISAASAEINETYFNAELTDCATAMGQEGKGMMQALLMELEKHLRSRRIKCLYTIARAESAGMNRAFYQLGYSYGGRMIKNCMIYSGLEDMNVWYK